MKVLRGMKDIIPPESKRWEDLIKKAGSVFSSFGYELSITPILEEEELFNRSVGSDSDVVSKEMYVFSDRSGEKIALRPENTASIMRVFLSGDFRGKVFKTWYWGPMFRHERPQKGRYRQFFQFGLEAIGDNSPYIDAELIYLLDVFYKKLGVEAKLEINSIGCKDCRPKYKKDLISFLSNEKLCPDCDKRMINNPLRVLDCKEEGCQKVVLKAPVLSNYLCEDCRDHFLKLLNILDNLKVNYKKSERLVRGLDYYVKTVFEFTSSELGGRQNALGGGGRYDELSLQLGGNRVPAVGYAGGIERTLMMMKENVGIENILYLALLNDELIDKFLPYALSLKAFAYDKNFTVINEFKSFNIKKHLEKANKLNASFMIILGEEEFKNSKLIFKNLKTKKEEFVEINDLETTVSEISRRIIENS